MTQVVRNPLVVSVEIRGVLTPVQLLADQEIKPTQNQVSLVRWIAR